MVAADPDIARLADHALRIGRLGHLVRVGLARVAHRLDLGRAEAGQQRVEAHRGKVGQLDPQQRLVPAAVFGQLIIGDQVGALLLVGPTASRHHRHLNQAQPLRSQHPPVPSYDQPGLIDQHRNRPAPLVDRRGNLSDLSLGMGPGVARVRG
jgi:hypothetical protein